MSGLRIAGRVVASTGRTAVPVFYYCALSLLPAAAAAAAAAGEVPAVVIVTDATAGAPVHHGLQALRRALRARGTDLRRAQHLPAGGGRAVVVAGLSRGRGAAARLLRSLRIEPPAGAESLLIRRVEQGGRPVLLVTGSGDRGLMYALLDLADRIGWAAEGAEPLSEVREAREAPAVVERAVSVYTMHRAWFESRLFDRRHWERYFDLLARSRFNSLCASWKRSTTPATAGSIPDLYREQPYVVVRLER